MMVLFFYLTFDIVFSHYMYMDNWNIEQVSLVMAEEGKGNHLDRENDTQFHPRSAAAVVYWEKFLPVRSLNILLAENDDSTCILVCALLRNCSYQVTATANGLQAWRVLEDETNHFDLVLAEVSMPYLSGIALLSKIKKHKTYKNIPVIMMSSHDSMLLVVKCLSKGAVDFLVKPLRKNELKNLWQHVWRIHQSSSDSGSASGTHTQKHLKLKDQSASHDTESSRTSEAVEVDSWYCANTPQGSAYNCGVVTAGCQEEDQKVTGNGGVTCPRNGNLFPQSSKRKLVEQRNKEKRSISEPSSKRLRGNRNVLKPSALSRF